MTGHDAPADVTWTVNAPPTTVKARLRTLLPQDRPVNVGRAAGQRYAGPDLDASSQWTDHDVTVTRGSGRHRPPFTLTVTITPTPDGATDVTLRWSPSAADTSTVPTPRGAPSPFPGGPDQALDHEWADLLVTYLGGNLGG